jgi:hypothetical protein
VNINELVRVADIDTDTCAFSTTGLHNGDPSRLTEIISSDDVLRMVREEPHVLPARIPAGFDLASA